MEKISDLQIKEIKDSVDIVDIIGSYLPLTPKGKNFFGICPFHDDHAPSMSVSKEKQIYTCFVCHETGNVFNFIMKYDNVSFLEAVKKVADISKINIDINLNTKQNNNSNNYLYEIYDLSNKFYKNNINTKLGIEAKEYLNKRSINEDIIKEFEIGLSLKDNKMLTKLLINKYKEEELIRSGLINKNNNGLNDTFYNRIMFPLYNLYGQVVGFSGRIYNSTDTSKYINSKESEIFKKGELLYNYHRAKDEARRLNQIIITEGFMDVIRLYSVGIKNVVAAMGTAFTKNHALLVKRMAKDVILMFDGDEAGEKATISCSNELMKIDVIPKIVRLENNLDPDEYILKYGSEAIINKINNPTNIMDYKLSILKRKKDLTKSQDMALYTKEMLEEISKIDDEILKELTLKKLSKETGLDIELLRSKIVTEEKKEVIIKPKNINISKYQKAEKNLIFYMLRYEEAIKKYQKKITYMPTIEYRYLARDISMFYNEKGYINISDLISEIKEDSIIKALGEIESLELTEEYNDQEIEDYIRVIKDYNVNFEIEKLKKEMSSTTDPLIKASIGAKIVEFRKSMEE